MPSCGRRANVREMVVQYTRDRHIGGGGIMAEGLKPIRRVVTGDDATGKSKVVWDGPAPAMHEASMGSGRGHIDFWVWNESPVPLATSEDTGHLHYDFPGPPRGGHWR